MILNELVLTNVGPFKGEHRIDLTPPSSDRPIVLVGGLNGAGKTTVLEAIQLALYGALTPHTGRRSGSYEKYLASLIHRGAEPDEGASIALTLTAHQEGSQREFWVRRSWKPSGNGVREILLVKVNGRINQALAGTWNEYVETLLPRGIAGLFFFDGEQIEAFADVEGARQVLRSALAALLGLDLVERLSADLTVLKRRHRPQELPAELQERIDETANYLTAHRQAETNAMGIEETRRMERAQAQQEFEQATEAYRLAGGELLDAREGAEQRARDLRRELGVSEDALRVVESEAAPLLMVGELLASLQERVRVEDAVHRNGMLLGELDARDEALVASLKSLSLESAAVEAVEGFLAADRADRAKASETAMIVDYPEPAALEHLMGSLLPAVSGALESGISLRTDLREELDQAERVLASTPDAEAMADLHQRRELARQRFEAATLAHAASELSRATAMQEREKAAAAHEAALDAAAHANLGAEDDQRLMEHVERVQKTLEQVRVTATHRHLERISGLILQSIQQLMRKSNLVTEVGIDATTYAVTLYGVDGKPLAPESLSAGERQLVAVALLWGLARASGQPLPMVVDTPLGRLDGTHREHLVERYFPHASHQVILLSTDTEIDHTAMERLAAYVGRAYRLAFDPAEHATRVEQGYFWGETA